MLSKQFFIFLCLLTLPVAQLCAVELTITTQTLTMTGKRDISQNKNNKRSYKSPTQIIHTPTIRFSGKSK